MQDSQFFGSENIPVLGLRGRRVKYATNTQELLPLRSSL